MDESGHSRTSTLAGFRRGAYLVLAGVFFLLGAVGAVLPGLPTTPFLLLTSYFLVRSSPRLHAALLRSRVFGPILRDWEERRGVKRSVKGRAIVVVVLFAGIAVFLSGAPVAARAATVGLVLIGIAVIIKLPEVPEDSEEPSEPGHASFPAEG